VKGFDNAFRRDYKALRNKVRCTRAVVELRVDEMDQARFRGMLRTITRRSGSHGAENTQTTESGKEQPVITQVAA
jgi:hypothetical protein